MRYLLDTSAILAHFRQEAGHEAVQDLFENREAELFVSSVTLTEFAHRLSSLGISHTEIQRTLNSYGHLFSAVVVIDVQLALAAYEVGRQTPQRVPLIDSLIAACAQKQDAILVHRDQHLANVPSHLIQQLYLEPSDKIQRLD